MKRAIDLLVAGAVAGFSGVWASEQPHKLLADVPNENTYVGQITLHGSLLYDESGELCLLVRGKDLRKLPGADAKARVCFFDQADLIAQLGISELVKQVDLHHTCGLSGPVVVTIDRLMTGVGPSSRWYSAHLLNPLGKARLVKIPCEG